MKKEPLLTGQIDMLLLAQVARGPAHGYAIIEQLRVRSDGVFDFPEGTIYPALYRLESLGMLESSTETVSGRPRRTYRVTRSGRAALKEREASWREFVRGVEAVLRGGAVARG
jgi:DNA-binding PadR family transcriptional regulator